MDYGSSQSPKPSVGTRFNLVGLIVLVLFATIAIGSISGCEQGPTKQLASDTLVLKASPDGGGVVPHPAGLPFTKAEIELGQMLFHSTALSSNGKVSCATCHNPSLSFTDGKGQNNLGVTSVKLDRSAPALVNLAWADSMFWDGRAFSLEQQALGPLNHPNEMGMDTTQLPAKVAEAIPKAKDYMIRIYGDPLINNQRIVRAIAMYERSLVSRNSLYDKYRRRDPGHRMMPDAMANGFLVFNVNCSNCHSGDNFTDNLYHNIGLEPWADLNSNKPGLARYRVTKRESDVGAYRTPGLRNIALTAPYMHDGRFKTLAEVVSFYSDHVIEVPNLDPNMRDNDRKPGLHITAQDQADLVVFLKALTDTAFVAEHRGDGIVK